MATIIFVIQISCPKYANVIKNKKRKPSVEYKSYERLRVIWGKIMNGARTEFVTKHALNASKCAERLSDSESKLAFIYLRLTSC